MFDVHVPYSAPVNISSTDDKLYFRQLLSGRDFATSDPLAHQMVNFIYLIGDRDTRECVVVDPAYAVDDIMRIIQEDDMTLTGVLATHYHPDHVGGSMMGHTIEGVSALLEKCAVPIHVQVEESPWVMRTTGLDNADLVTHSSGDIVSVGDVEITLLHTPGHTPGSQCFLAGNCLVSGDTLFLEGCGRTDLPGSDVVAMYDSLQRLASLPNDTIVLPGHQYSSVPFASIEEVKQVNYVYKPPTREAWMSWFGGTSS